MFFIFLVSLISSGHIVGSSAWCLANSPYHFECYFLDQERCEQEAHRRANKGEPEWQCVPFPMDFRNIPKSGEVPASTTTVSELPSTSTTTSTPLVPKKLKKK
jgi:hypothetical protein